jgi:Uma2 family endonuclease
MASVPARRLTPDEYLAMERTAPLKSEYVDGEVFAMSGASRAHILIAVNIATSLNVQLRDTPCEVYANDLRVEIDEGGQYFYPDVVVVCEEPRFSDSQHDTLLNPLVIIEVLSPSTEAFDRGEKFACYRRLASLQEYVLVSQTEHRIERFGRQPNGQWLLSEASGLDAVLHLSALPCHLRLADVYDKVHLAAAPRQPSQPEAR